MHTSYNPIEYNIVIKVERFLGFYFYAEYSFYQDRWCSIKKPKYHMGVMAYWLDWAGNTIHGIWLQFIQTKQHVTSNE